MRPTVSFWFDGLAEDLAPAPPLEASTEADVCIVGGGYTGLWTAYELKRTEPSLEVVLLESHHCGFGASGRNGGWVIGELAGRPEWWAARGGREAAIALRRAMRASVGEIERVVLGERIDCDLVVGGTLAVARTPVELERLRALVAYDREWDVGPEQSRLIDAAEVRDRVAISGAVGARFSPDCARVQPAKLVRGLATAVRNCGVRVHEMTPALAIEPGRVRTAGGEVRARQIVRATEAYTADLPGQRRLLAPVTSTMIVTEPLGSDLWAALGWDDCETLLDGLHRYHYLQRTADGRIAIGGRGSPYRFGSLTDREGPVSRRTVDQLRARLGSLFGPEVGAVPIAAAWHGVLGVPRDWQPRVWLDRSTGIAWAGGYAGEGVAAANLAGRTLRDLLLDRDTPLTKLPWVEPAGRPWEHEPLRYLGIQAVYGTLGLADRLEGRTGRKSGLATVADRLAGRKTSG